MKVRISFNAQWTCGCRSVGFYLSYVFSQDYLPLAENPSSVFEQNMGMCHFTYCVSVYI